MRKLFLTAVVVGGLVWAWPAEVTAQCSQCADEPDPPFLYACPVNPLIGNCPSPADETSNCGCDWFENFETYATGTLPCINGWEGWACDDPSRGEITTEQDHTSGGGVSIAIDSQIDQVWRFYPANGGTYDMGTGGAEGDGMGYDLDVSDCWVFKAWSFVPLGHGGDSFLIMLSRYGDTGPPGGGWAIELVMDATELTNDFGPGTLPLSLGKWALFEIQVNLDVDWTLIFYDGVFLGAQGWTFQSMDQLLFSALDLFNSGSRVYWDDISMTAVECLPPCSEDSECNDANVCTQDQCVGRTCVNSGKTYGDVDNDGDVDLFDLFCILNCFENDFSICPFEKCDLDPCDPATGAAGNGMIDLFDLFAVLNAFSGIDPCCGGLP